MGKKSKLRGAEKVEVRSTAASTRPGEVQAGRGRFGAAGGRSAAGPGPLRRDITWYRASANSIRQGRAMHAAYTGPCPGASAKV